MTMNERDLLHLIREYENPEQALLAAVLIIGRVLEQRGVHQAPSSVHQSELA